MTYLEIIEWINESVSEIWRNLDEIAVEYYDDVTRRYEVRKGTYLISIVLEINNKELIK